MNPKPALPAINPWMVAVSVMFGTFMEVLDTTVVNVSLPHIAGSMSASIDEATWVLTSYLVANAIILPITGWLASRFGRKNLLMASVIGFTASSFMCGIAPNLALLVLFRLLQGASGGCLQPLSQAVLLEAFPAEQRGKAMGFWGLGIVVAPVMGPVLGGWLTDNYSWRWVFYINIPVGIASILMTRMFIFDPPYLRRERGGVDYWGIGMLAVWIGALQIVLDKGQQEDWFESAFIRWFAVATLVALTGFLIREFVAKRPVVNLRIFKDRTYAAGVFLMTIVGFVLYGSLVLLPLWLQTLLGYPSLQAGIAMAPRGLGSMLGMPLVGSIIGKIDPRKILAVGLSLGAFTLYDLSRLNLEAGYWDFFWPQFLQGIALSMLFVPLTTITMSQISREAMGNATSLFNLMRNIGGSIGIAMVTTMNARFTQTYVSRLGENVTAYNSAAMDMLRSLQSMWSNAGSGSALAERQAAASMFGLVQRQAAMLAFIQLFLLLAVIFLAMIPLIVLMKRPPRGARAEMGLMRTKALLLASLTLVFCRAQSPPSKVLGSIPTGSATGIAIDLTNEDAIARGLRYNLALTEGNENVRIQRAERLRALSALLPTVTARPSVTEQQVSLAALGFTGFPGVPSILGPFTVFDARAALSQSMLNFRSLRNYRAAREQVSATEHTARDLREQVVVVVTNLYLNAIAGSARVDAQRSQVATADAAYRQAVVRKNAGTAPGIDVLRAGVELNSTQQRLIFYEGEFDKQRLALGRAIGLPPGQELRIVDTASYTPLPSEVTLEATLQAAYEQRSDYRAAQALVRAAELTKGAAKAGRYPSAGLDANYGAIGQRVTRMRGSFTVVGAVEIPIFQGGRVQADVDEADAQLRQRRAELEDLRGRIDADVRNAFTDMRSASRQVEVAVQNVSLARQQLQQAQDRFGAGVTNNLEVVQAQQALALADENQIAALYAFNTAKAALVRARGDAERSIKDYLRRIQ